MYFGKVCIPFPFCHVANDYGAYMCLSFVGYIKHKYAHISKGALNKVLWTAAVVAWMWWRVDEATTVENEYGGDAGYTLYCASSHHGMQLLPWRRQLDLSKRWLLTLEAVFVQGCPQGTPEILQCQLLRSLFLAVRVVTSPRNIELDIPDCGVAITDIKTAVGLEDAILVSQCC